MQSPVRIEFQGMNPADAVQDKILRYVAELERRVTAGHVVVKVPGEHHRTGGLYEINIRLALPDYKEVNVGHTQRADERHSDIDFALHDAFKRARRQLQDRTRRCGGTSKRMRPSPRAGLRIWKTSSACWKPQMDVTSTSIATACSTAILRS